MVSVSRLCAVLLLPLTAACADETLSGYADPGAEYVLQTIDGAPFAARATITFPHALGLAGQAPCNRYSGALQAPYPWFETGPLAATKMACPDLAAEGVFFNALNQMTLAEVAGKVLILTNDAGHEMVFRAP